MLGIDRSEKAIAQAVAASAAEVAAGDLGFRAVAIENFDLGQGEEPYDIAFAVRVGALDGRHREIEQAAMSRIASALRMGGRLFLDGGCPLREVRVGTV